jgi:exodeoxyribonuclease VII large subunit
LQVYKLTSLQVMKYYRLNKLSTFYLINMSTSELVNFPAANDVELSVSQASQMIAGVLQQNFDDITIKGEISGFKAATSGHLYFSIKDENAVLNAICWRGVASSILVKLEDGMEVIIRGGIATYPSRSNYQIIAKEIRTSGVGTLMALLEKRKKMLEAEGLFDFARKKPIPFMPKCIGIVTSPTGAVIRDILHRLNDRWGCQVYIYPCLVQGENAAEQIKNGIEFFNSSIFEKDHKLIKPDTIIVARGGGSIEDLWAFNEEILVRAAAASKIPLISAVGHETDTTLIDYASDKRAPTPTAAAEMATPVREELQSLVIDYNKRLFTGIQRVLNEKKNYIIALARGLVSPVQMLGNMQQKLDDRAERLNTAMANFLNNKNKNFDRLKMPEFILKQMVLSAENKLKNYASLLNSYDHRNVLKRGFALVKGANGQILKSIANLKPQDILRLELADGNIAAQVIVDGGMVDDFRADDFSGEKTSKTQNEDLKNKKIIRERNSKKTTPQNNNQESLF